MNIQRVFIFAAVFLILGVIAHHAVTPQRTVSVAPPLPMNAPMPAPAPAPMVSISRIWPDGATPTKIIQIPDPQEPAKGLMEITLHRGDDLEVDVAPLWLFEPMKPNYFSGIQVLIDEGSGFQTFAEYHQSRINDPDSPDMWLKKLRIYRMRLAPENQHDTTCSVTIEQHEPPKPLPPVPPQAYGDLTITYDGFRGLPDRSVLVYLTFHNYSAANTMAVAMHDEGCIMLPCRLRSSLVCSDGTPYIVDTSGLTGISGMRTNPQLLTTIGPGQELKTSLQFEPRGVGSPSINSVWFQGEVVVNSNWQPGEYSNYRETGRDVMPPYCDVINIIFDIPLRTSN